MLEELMQDDLFTVIAVAVGVILVFGIVIIFSISTKNKRERRDAD